MSKRKNRRVVEQGPEAERTNLASGRTDAASKERANRAEAGGARTAAPSARAAGNGSSSRAGGNAPSARAAEDASPSRAGWDWRAVCAAGLTALCTALYFCAVCLSSAATIKVATIVLSVLALGAVVLLLTKRRGRIGVPLVALALVVLMDAISTFYAVSGKFALLEFLKLLCALDLGLILLALAPGAGARPGRWIAKVLSGFCAVAGLTSIDMLSTHLFSGAVLGFLGLFTGDYSAISGLETGIRMTSMFDIPNVFAGITGIGVLLSLGLAMSSEGRRERIAQTALLYINALAFLLAFSMGASGSIAVAFVALLLLARRRERTGLFILMVEALACTVVAAAVISLTSFGPQTGFQPVPLLCAIAGAAALCALNELLGRRIAARLEGRERLVPLLGVAIAALLAVFVLAAYNLTGPANLEPAEALRRAADLEPGTYALTVDADGPLNVTIESQDQRETMMHTSTVLYSGSAEGAEFAVPEGSLVTYFNFHSAGGGEVRSVAYAGEAGSGEVPLGYKLLPGFIANRLQGLWANENAIQRFVFFADGLKLFRRSPVVGLGLGAFENGYRSVQSFAYTTRYAHNHYIQTLSDTGVVGLALLLLLLASCAAAVALDRRRGEESHPLTPALGAALVFMAIHGAIEASFSVYFYLPVAFGVFALISLCCGDAISKPKLNAKGEAATLLGISALVIVYTALLGCNLAAKSIAQSERSFEAMEEAISLDRFEWADYALSYVINAPNAEDDREIMARADAYAQRLAKQDSNTIPIYLAEYYFKTDRTEEAMAMVEKYVAYVSSDAQSWQDAFDLMLEYEQDAEAYRAGVRRVAEMLEEWNAENMGEIQIDESARALIERAGG